MTQKNTTTTMLDSDYKRIPELFEQNDLIKMMDALDKITFQKDFYWDKWIRLRNKAILCLLWYGGLRPKEACYLKFSDFKDGKLLIRGENNHSKRDRIIPLKQEMMPYLIEYLELGKRNKEWVFPSFNDKTQPLSPTRWKAIMREYILKPIGRWIPAEKGTVPRTRSYSLRASFAVRTLKKSNNLKYLQELMGHKDLRTLAHYVRLTMNDNPKHIDNLREAMG